MDDALPIDFPHDRLEPRDDSSGAFGGEVACRARLGGDTGGAFGSCLSDLEDQQCERDRSGDRRDGDLPPVSR